MRFSNTFHSLLRYGSAREDLKTVDKKTKQLFKSCPTVEYSLLLQDYLENYKTPFGEPTWSKNIGYALDAISKSEFGSKAWDDAYRKIKRSIYPGRGILPEDLTDNFIAYNILCFMDGFLQKL